MKYKQVAFKAEHCCCSFQPWFPLLGNYKLFCIISLQSMRLLSTYMDAHIFEEASGKTFYNLNVFLHPLWQRVFLFVKEKKSLEGVDDLVDGFVKVLWR